MPRSSMCLPISCALLAVAGLVACQPEVVEAPPPIRPVRTVAVEATGAGRTRAFSGTSQASVESRISFKVAGSVEALKVKVGDKVKKGQVIARLDPQDYRLRVQQADASRTQASSQARNAEANYQRVKALYANRNASRSDLDQARAAAESAKASVQAANKQRELARLQLSYATLESPMAGLVAQVPVQLNENVQAGQMIVLLTSGGQPEVEVAVPEVLISQVKKGDAAEVKFDARPGDSFKATVLEVGVSTVGTGTTFPVTVRLEGDTQGIRPGMAAEVSLQFGESGEAERYVLPPVAVGEDAKGRFVYVLEKGEAGKGVTRRRDVQVGNLVPGGLEVLEGVKEGEQVVTAGVSKIRDGLVVKLLPGQE